MAVRSWSERAKKSRHLRQPRRRLVAKRLEQFGTIGAAAKLLQTLDQRHEGFVGSKQFVAATAQHPKAKPSEPLHRHVDQRRLADPRLAGDEDDLPVARQGLLHQALEISSGADRPTHQRSPSWAGWAGAESGCQGGGPTPDAATTVTGAISR
jgi:hypothetical protein